MADLFFVAAIGAWLFFVYSVWQVMRLLGGWKPAVARVWRSDYTEDQQREDRWSLGFTMLTSRGYNWRDGDHGREIEDEILFTPDDGRERRALVTRQVHRGWKPSGHYTIWYDCADPDNVTAYGPWYWGLMAVLSVVMLCVLGNTLARMGLPPMLANLVQIVR